MNVLHRIDPLLARLRPRVGLSNDFRQAAKRSWELGPGMEAESPAAICEPSDLLKVSGVHGNATTIEKQLARTKRRMVWHRPTIAYELEDVALCGGNLYSRKALYWLSGGRARWLAESGVPEYEHAALAITDYGKRYFGHWMWDDLPMQLAAREIGTLVSTLIDPTPSQIEYAQLLGLRTDVHVDAYFRRLVIIDDCGQNEHKRARYHQLRDLSPIQQAMNAPGVMLLRGTSGARRVLVNEQEVAEMARRRGFVALDATAMSARELLAACMKAPVVLSVEGSHMANGVMWMSYTGTVVVIMPPQRFEILIKDRCDCLGIGFAIAVGDQVSETDFSVDCGAVERLLDRVQ